MSVRLVLLHSEIGLSQCRADIWSAAVCCVSPRPMGWSWEPQGPPRTVLRLSLLARWVSPFGVYTGIVKV